MIRKLLSGNTVIAYLHSPREKIWGLLLDLDSAGAYIHGIDLSAFDDWLKNLASGESGLGLTSVFIPMWRVERLARDEATAGIPALEDHFRQRAGSNLKEWLDRQSSSDETDIVV